MNYKIRYGGSVCDENDYKAVMKSVKQSIKSGGWQQGEQGALFEEELTEYLGIKNAILTTSGTTAGILALSALELPKGSEIIISATTFPTIFNMIIQQGFVPVVVTSKIRTYNFDPKDVEKAITKKTSAIIAIHALGNPCDMPAIMRIAKAHNIKVIEDNCDGIGGMIGVQHLGTFADISFTSFHAAHIISMGVGGGVFTNDDKLAQNVRQYRDWGRIANTDKPHTCKTLPKDYNPRFVYDKIGYNFQILDLQAAMGRVQLKRIEEIKRKRQANFDYLYWHLSKHKQLIMPKFDSKADVCWFAFPLSIKSNRGKLVKFLEKNGIETRSMFAGNIVKHPAYKNTKYKVSGSLKEADFILKNSLWIGVHPRMTKKDRQYVVDVFNKFFNVKTS